MDPKLRTLLFFVLQSMLLLSPSLANRKTYIVHMDPTHMPSAFSRHEDWYSSHLLQSLSSSDTITTTSSSSSPLIYTYSAAYNGYAASLTPDEAESLRSSSGGAVIGIYEDTVYNLHTTRTPEFLGLDSPAVASASDHIPAPSGDVIVGILDTGIWPESASFDDAGLPPVPSRWRGECESASDFKPSLCNRKLIGARSFSRGYAMAAGSNFMKNPTEKDSPRDYDGHGTHTASTAAGSKVANASLLGYASGTARGMAPPRARVAAYKVCWTSGCFGSDILAGMDRAILDGVDVLSLSLGGGSAPYYRDTIATGAFSAMVKGIFVSCSAGNSGPAKSSLANTAPWIMTVGAGTLDRDFPSYATLGDGRRVAGVSLYSGKGMGKKLAALVYGNGNVGNNTSSSANGNMCLTGTLDPKMVKGKVVLCDRGVNARVEKGAVVRDAGGVGMILANTAANGEELVADSHLIPAVAVGKKSGDGIREYVKRAGTNAKATLSFGGTVLGVKPSPVVAAFSSRGPNLVTPQILKPDVIGPGVNILAAWSEAVGPTGLDKDTRRSKFNIMSGTSMSCPHISGLAALIKAAHPDWSPSAIKSALMTTAYTHDNALSPLQNAEDGSVSNPWAYGAGHVNPRQALSPGLIYDITPQDYISFICSLGYTLDRVRGITKMPNVTCSTKLSEPGQLNYPSFSVLFGKIRTVRYTRELTNVGPDRSFYQVTADVPTNVGVKVRPSKLFFRKAGEKKKYTVTFVARKGKAIPKDRAGFGSIMWFNKQNQVRSPVSFMWNHQV